MQEGKSAMDWERSTGAADTYWGKNKGRSMEGKTGNRIPRVLVWHLFLVIAAVLTIWDVLEEYAKRLS